MTTPALTLVDEIATDVAVGDMSATQALAELRARGLTPDRDALAEAVAAIHLRDAFAAQLGNPYDYTGIEVPSPFVNVWDEAVKKAEEELAWSLRKLARPSVQAVAS